MSLKKKIINYPIRPENMDFGVTNFEIFCRRCVYVQYSNIFCVVLVVNVSLSTSLPYLAKKLG